MDHILGRPNFDSHQGATATWILSEFKDCTYTVYYGGAAALIGIFACFLLLLYTLLAGFILAVCSQDKDLLDLDTLVGTEHEKRRIRALLKLKQRQIWMICSLMFISVAIGQWFTFLLKSILPRNDALMTGFVSTICLSLGGIPLQCYMLRRAQDFGFHGRSIIWACMFITGIVSYPLAFFLDKADRARPGRTPLRIFPNEKIGGFIRHYTKGNGGNIGLDASRIMLGALKLSERSIGGGYIGRPWLRHDRTEQDLLKADTIVSQGIIVDWSAVKAVRIDDPVDDDFINKIGSCGYSRFPVISTPGKESATDGPYMPDWPSGSQIHGFLHVKSLLEDITIQSRTPGSPILVKDLPLYPLPIIDDDMPALELLDMFQTGLSRMAVVVPSGKLTSKNGAVWTVTEKTTNRTVSKLERVKESRQWGTDYLVTAKAMASEHEHMKHHSYGVRLPKPMGIVTLEDILDSILQKTSCNEKDFYDRPKWAPVTKTKRPGDFPVDEPAIFDFQPGHTPDRLPTLMENIRYKLRRLQNIKNITKKFRRTAKKPKDVEKAQEVPEDPTMTGALDNAPPGAMDGADEGSVNRQHEDKLVNHKARTETGESSYTQNSQGGFHKNILDRSYDDGNGLSAEAIAGLIAASSPEEAKPALDASKLRSLPSRKHDFRSSSDELKQTFRHVSALALLPSLRQATQLGKPKVNSFNDDSTKYKKDATMLGRKILARPLPGCLLDRSFDPNASGIEIDSSMEELFDCIENSPFTEKDKIHTSSQSSGDELGGQEVDEDMHDLYDAFLVPLSRCSPALSHHTVHSLSRISEGEEKKSVSSPAEGSVLNQPENRRSSKILSTLPRSVRPTYMDMSENRREKSAHEREQSFHDDRALLPSQRGLVFEGGQMVAGSRSTSLWF